MMTKTRRIALMSASLMVAIIILAPFSWLILTSFMTEVEALSVPPHWIPENPTLQNYAFFLDPRGEAALLAGGAAMNLPRALFNSCIIAFGVALINIVVGVPAAYSFARLRFTGDRPLLFTYLGSRMVPGLALIIPFYIFFSYMGWIDSLLALIIVDTTFTLPFTIWVLMSYFETIPVELEDAARVDRCNWFQSIIYVLLPVARPGIAAAAMFAFMSAWAEFLFAVILSSTPKSKPLTVVVSELATDVDIQFTLMATAGVIAVIIPLSLALTFRHWIIKGLMSGSLKG